MAYRERRPGLLRRAYLAQLQREMTSEEIDELMVKTIIDSVDDRGTIVREDFIKANVPADAINDRFKKCLAIAISRVSDLSQRISVAA